MVNKNEPHCSSPPNPTFHKLGNWGPDCNQSLKSYSRLAAKLFIYSIFGMVRLCCNNKQHHIFSFSTQWKFVWPFHQVSTISRDSEGQLPSCSGSEVQAALVSWHTHLDTCSCEFSDKEIRHWGPHVSSAMCQPRSIGGGLLIAGPSLPVQSGSRPVGFSGYGSQAPERWLDSDGAWAPCWLTACWVFPDQGPEPCLLRWQAESLSASQSETPWFVAF